MILLAISFTKGWELEAGCEPPREALGSAGLKDARDSAKDDALNTVVLGETGTANMNSISTTALQGNDKNTTGHTHSAHSARCMALSRPPSANLKSYDTATIIYWVLIYSLASA